jgi:hypothetical protein
MVKEESSLPWEARALDGLELPLMLGLCYPPSKIQFLLNFKFGRNKFAKNNGLTDETATKWAVIGDQTGGIP